MDILAYTMDEILDPTNIIEGKRFEFLLDIEVDEEDELFVEGGLEIRVIAARKEDDIKLANYYIVNKGTEEMLDFALEEDEEEMILNFCKVHIIAGE
ncbi:pullulanase [Viridibacillus sp. YIM B01967]|uniref:Pullulanase n=1 Tax=Viridibacillus soli TaxID=2798301 RepID=A0ABS1H933_9BACL|nr:DUF6509 family protein [Viridibacillus soli]MBK3495910.1 pullulanase [Viridibacillus soli]